MKNIIKIILLTLVVTLALSLCSCKAIERIFLGGDPYSFSDIVMTQTGVNEFRIEFSVDCGKDKVDIYFTEGFRLLPSIAPKEVEKTVDGDKARFSFTETLCLGEDYYLWAVCGDKEAKITIPAPSMFPSITGVGEGAAQFNFNYTYGTAWGSFCDPNGKAVYYSEKPEFDDSAILIQDGIEITVENCLIPSDKLEGGYFYSVSTAKDGSVKIISRPVRVYDDLIASVEGISASLTTDARFCVEIEIPEGAVISPLVEECLELVIKTNMADEIYVIDCVYENGIAKMYFDASQLIFDGVWYDLLIAWDGAIVMDVPKYFEGGATDSSSTIKKNGVLYSIVSWKPDNAPESSAMLKLCFEEDITKYADEILRSYIVTFDTDGDATLQVTVKLRSETATPPILAITAGDNTILASASGVKMDDGSYSYSLEVCDAMTVSGTWYDLRFFLGGTPYEMLKDSCITYESFSGIYKDSGCSRTYEFKEWNGFLKLCYSNAAN